MKPSGGDGRAKGIERRRYRRVDYVVSIEIDGKERPFRGRTVNVSVRGMLIESEELLNRGDKGIVRLFESCGEDSLLIGARFEVAWMMPREPGGCSCGVELTEIDSESSINLYNIVRYQSGEVE